MTDKDRANDAMTFTGERYVPEIGGQIAFEHLHRYRFAAELAMGKDVLDVACGEGYGSDFLARAARSVVGVDIAPEVIAHARTHYGRPGLEFAVGSAAELPFEDASFDLVVSFETIEHHDRHVEMLAEIKRVLRPDGLLVISSPNRQHYSVDTGYVNPFHVKELFREEFVALVRRFFSGLSLHAQRVVHGSLIAPEDAAVLESEREGEGMHRRAHGLLMPLYDLIIAGDGVLPAPRSSLFEMQIHGMDPAAYYGVHLPERVNEADQECGRLTSWRNELQVHADALQELRARLEEKVARLEEKAAWFEQKAAQLEQGRRESEATLHHERVLHAEVVEGFRQERIRREALDSLLAAERAARVRLETDTSAEKARHNEAEAVLRRELAWRDERLHDAMAQSEFRRVELEQILASNSWKLSAPLRWLRDHIAAIREGRPAASFKQVLGLPHAKAVAQPLIASQEGAPTFTAAQGAYLDALFADREESRSPDYLPRSDAPSPAPATLRAKLIAFYLPQFHPCEENDAWWGKGFTEWTNVTSAKPQFVGHDQPQLPGDLGFYDLRLPDVIRQQVDLARQYGVFGFCFHYYWFAGRRLLERPLDLFLQDDGIDFPFCLCWANENWTRRWDGHDHEVLIAQEHTPENDLAFIRDLEPYLRDRRYIRMDGKPLVIVYRPSLLPDCAATLERWRQHCRAVGIGEIFLAMAQFDVEDPRQYGFDAALEFPPHKLAAGLEPINTALDIVNPQYRGHVVHYQAIVDSAKTWPTPEFPLIRGVFPGWDNEARRQGCGYTFAFATPARYREWLEAAVDFAEHHPVAGERLVMVNAWNEWAEGAHLEPDRRHGHAYLQATRDVVAPRARKRSDRSVVVVSHDAHPHGAQYLALHLCRELRALGCTVEAVLLGDGALAQDFAAAADRVHRLQTPGGDDAGHALAQALAARGFSAAIANTTVAGLFAGDLKQAGLRVVSLVHELPGVLREYGLERNAACVAEHADRVVFAADVVRDGFTAIAPLPEGKALIRRQGLYKRNRHRTAAAIAAARKRLRARFGLAADTRIVLGVGYADLRKGVDLFVAAGAAMARARQDVHFVWLGHADTTLEDALRAQIAASGAPERFHMVGRDPDTDDYYAGADVLALTSREDPFPSVVMEALDVGVPVVAFAGTGGCEAFLQRAGGRVVPAFDTDAFAHACLALLADEPARRQLGEEGKSRVDAEFSFRRYAFDLLDAAGIAIPRVSVVVPNFNYARYLSERLDSILRQTLPPMEIIVLDDASTDGSLEDLAALSARIEMRVLPNARNSGSVFRQWLRGVEAASAPFVWIAEADDLSEPTFLETALRGLADDDVVLSYCQSQQIDERGELLAPDYLDYVADLSVERWRHPFVATGKEEVLAGLAVKNTIPNVSAAVFRREALLAVLRDGIEEIAGFRIAGDWLTYLRLLEHGRVAYSPIALNRHRRHAAGVTMGADHRPHLDEVLRVQEIAQVRHGAASEAPRARAYADALCRHFGLAETTLANGRGGV